MAPSTLESPAFQAVEAAKPLPRMIVKRMRRAFLSICRCGDTLFSPYGVTTDQYALIREVQRHPGIRQADLGTVIFAEPNTVTAMVTLLEKRGILRRKPSTTDRRAKQVYLTQRGEMVMQRLWGDWRPMHDILLECFAAPGGQEALTILDEIYERMRVERDKLMNVPDAPANELAADGLAGLGVTTRKRRSAVRAEK